MVKHYYTSCQADDIENSLCFQILGFDIMIDHQYCPYLIEVNQMPSLATESPLDVKIKRGLVTDLLRKLCLNGRKKANYKAEKRARHNSTLLSLNTNTAGDGDDHASANGPSPNKKDFKEDVFKQEEIKKIEQQKDQQKRVIEE